jgi:hypothetical protein
MIPKFIIRVEVIFREKLPGPVLWQRENPAGRHKDDCIVQ